MPPYDGVLEITTIVMILCWRRTLLKKINESESLKVKLYICVWGGEISQHSLLLKHYIKTQRNGAIGKW